MISYRKPFRNAPSDAYAVELDITVPLWFFTRQANEVESAQARMAAAEGELSAMRAKTRAEARALFAKTESFAKMLKIYSSALVPQASSTLSSSQSAYAAGRTTFLELLDAERSLFDVRIGYYRNLAKYIENLTRLERVTGTRLSSLPFGEEQ
jgi:cobalt-zinc-cadmium efflux system outer membrane protein